MSTAPFAIKFEPEAGGSSVDLAVYTNTLAEIQKGFQSLRTTLAPILAEKERWPTSEVREYLRPAVLPTEKGSLLVPMTIGRTGYTGPLQGQEKMARVFWRYSGSVLRGAAAQRSGVADIPASTAEHFVRAARHANEGRASLQLVERGDARWRSKPNREEWRSTANLTRLENGLSRYAERRSLRRSTHTTVMGRVVGIGWDPPQLHLEMASGKRIVAMSADQRSKARELWGEKVVAELVANMTLDGEIRDTPKLVNVHAAIQVADLVDDFDRSFGARREVWGTEEAEEYVRDITRKD